MVVSGTLICRNDYALVVTKVIECLLLHLLLRSIGQLISTSNWPIILLLFNSVAHGDPQFLLILTLLSGVVRCLVLLHWILYLG